MSDVTLEKEVRTFRYRTAEGVEQTLSTVWEKDDGQSRRYVSFDLKGETKELDKDGYHQSRKELLGYLPPHAIAAIDEFFR